MTFGTVMVSVWLLAAAIVALHELQAATCAMTYELMQEPDKPRREARSLSGWEGWALEARALTKEPDKTERDQAYVEPLVGCQHPNRVDVDLALTGDVVARLCLDCDEQFDYDPRWSL